MALHIAVAAKDVSLGPLAVHLDNGQKSELVKRNMERMLQKLRIGPGMRGCRDSHVASLEASRLDSETARDHAVVLNAQSSGVSPPVVEKGTYIVWYQLPGGSNPA